MRRLYIALIQAFSLCAVNAGTATDTVKSVVNSASAEELKEAESALTFKVTQFGAKCDGTTLDVAAINRAVATAHNVGGGIVIIPTGVCVVGGGLNLKPQSNVYLRGQGQGATILKLLVPTANHIFANHDAATFQYSVTNSGISDLTIDAGSYRAEPRYGAVFFDGASDFYVRNVKIIHMGAQGIIIQAAHNCDISNNSITLDSAYNTNNHGILATAAAPITNCTFNNNTINNTGMEISGARLTITGNKVTGWKYGAGIALGPDGYTHDNLIANNITSGGIGIDSDATYVAGLEIWSLRSIVTGNISFNNSGNGIMIGGQNSIVIGNITYDNGQSLHSGDRYGIYVQSNSFHGGAFTATISGTVMTVSAVSSGNNLAAGQTVYGSGILPNTYITGQVSGISGGTGVYSLNRGNIVDAPMSMKSFFSGGNSIVSGNNSFNLSGTTQAYGYGEAVDITGMQVGPNNFYNNAIAPVSVSGKRQ